VKDYEPTKKRLQQAGALPALRRNAEAESKEDDLAAILREAAERAALAGQRRQRMNSENI